MHVGIMDFYVADRTLRVVVVAPVSPISTVTWLAFGALLLATAGVWAAAFLRLSHCAMRVLLHLSRHQPFIRRLCARYCRCVG